MYIDTHAHLTMPEYQDIAEVIERAKAAGVEAIIDVAFDIEGAHRSLRMSKDYDFIYTAVGIHPHDAGAVTDKTLTELKELAKNPKIVAIGETGLDFYKNLSPRDSQKEIFRAHLQLAQELDLPVLIHDRDAHEDVMTIIREENRGSLRGIMHCFSGDLKMAQWAMNMGFYISFAGSVTFKNARRLWELALDIPLPKLVIETDCPYLSPEPHRGKRNEPAYIIHIAAKIAEIKKVPLNVVAEVTTENAKKLFRIK